MSPRGSKTGSRRAETRKKCMDVPGIRSLVVELLTFCRSSDVVLSVPRLLCSIRFIFCFSWNSPSSSSEQDLFCALNFRFPMTFLSSIGSIAVSPISCRGKLQLQRSDRGLGCTTRRSLLLTRSTEEDV